MTDIVAFIEARIAEREGQARMAGGNEWTCPGSAVVDIAQGGDLDDLVTVGDREAAQHMADNDPRYVLDDMVAKRDILAEHRRVRKVCWRCRDENPEYDGVTMQDWPCRTVRLLALPFAGHSDYREEWRP